MKMVHCVFVWALMLFTGTNLWAIPAGFNVQGRLTTADGINKDGTFPIKFSVYATAVGGVPVWVQNKPSVNVINGNFQVVLQGTDDNTIQLETAVKDLDVAYVEIKVGDEAAFVPRQPLLRSPFSSPNNFVGAVMFFAGSTCPAGWLLANGAILSPTGIYEALFNQLQFKYDPAGHQFMLPNMVDGSFIRGPGVNAANLGVKQADALKTHTHEVSLMGRGIGASSGGTNISIPYPLSPGNYYDYSVTSANASSGESPETRPLNYAMTPCIKY